MKSGPNAGHLVGRRLAPEPLSITIRTTTYKYLSFNCLGSSTTILDLKTLIQCQHRVPVVLQSLTLFGKILDDKKTLEQHGITDGAIIDLATNMRNSVICLLGSNRATGAGTKDIKVELSLNRAWEISLLRPSMKVSSSDYAQSVTWTVDAKHDGTLLDHESGKEMPHLHWDGLWVFRAHRFYVFLPLNTQIKSSRNACPRPILPWQTIGINTQIFAADAFA
jgi:hypothetical protein